MKNVGKICALAYLSRFFLVCFQYFANQAIQDHDAKVFMYPISEDISKRNTLINHFIGGFLRWDAQYFMHIAKYGYTYENTLAFFPLYPIFVGYIANILAFILGANYIDSILLVTFILLNMLVFEQSVLTLYKLTKIIFNERIAYYSAILFCFNPASIFFIAPYTECLFSYLTFLSMVNCISLYKKYTQPQSNIEANDFILILPIALSTIARSNGVINVGFLLYSMICSIRKNMKGKPLFQWIYLFRSFHYGFVLVLALIYCLLPFIVYQYYCYKHFCQTFSVSLPKLVLDHAKDNKFILPGTYQKNNQKWCDDVVPLAYAYVQDHYWNVGFLKYYKLKQLPNFMLAMPILSVTIFACTKHMYINIFMRRTFEVFTLENPKKKKKKSAFDIYQPKLTVFYVHILFLSVFCMFFVHIQVSTRILCSASPVFYWVCAKQLNMLKLPSKLNLKEFLLSLYFLSYFIGGTVLFCNFLPWT